MDLLTSFWLIRVSLWDTKQLQFATVLLSSLNRSLANPICGGVTSRKRDMCVGGFPCPRGYIFNRMLCPPTLNCGDFMSRSFILRFFRTSFSLLNLSMRHTNRPTHCMRPLSELSCGRWPFGRLPLMNPTRPSSGIPPATPLTSGACIALEGS